MSNKTDFALRSFKPADITPITEIYAHYVTDTIISFDLEAPDFFHMKKKIGTIYRNRRPLIIATIDEQLVGYAYASTYRTRPAYRFTCENAIYLHPDYVGQGLGTLLFERLILKAQEFGYNQMVAVISKGSDEFEASTKGSIALHKKFGFEILGEFPELGYKFNKWHGVIHMQKKL